MSMINISNHQILDTLGNKPEIAIVSTFDTVSIDLLGIINPILSLISLLIGISVGIVTLYLQINKVRKSQDRMVSWKLDTMSSNILDGRKGC